eukprot:1304736-Rhodomonas_salina.2
MSATDPRVMGLPGRRASRVGRPAGGEAVQNPRETGVPRAVPQARAGHAPREGAHVAATFADIQK